MRVNYLFQINKRESFTKYPKGEIRDDLATFTIGGIDERLGKDPLEKLPATDYNMHSITFEGDKQKIVITSGTFEASKHKLFYYYDKKYLVSFDAHKFDETGKQLAHSAVPCNWSLVLSVLLAKSRKAARSPFLPLPWSKPARAWMT